MPLGKTNPGHHMIKFHSKQFRRIVKGTVNKGAVERQGAVNKGAVERQGAVNKGAVERQGAVNKGAVER